MREQAEDQQGPIGQSGERDDNRAGEDGGEPERDPGAPAERAEWPAQTRQPCVIKYWKHASMWMALKYHGHRQLVK